jgi:hypothetical protein
MQSKHIGMAAPWQPNAGKQSSRRVAPCRKGWPANGRHHVQGLVWNRKPAPSVCIAAVELNSFVSEAGSSRVEPFRS